MLDLRDQLAKGAFDYTPLIDLGFARKGPLFVYGEIGFGTEDEVVEMSGKKADSFGAVDAGPGWKLLEQKDGERVSLRWKIVRPSTQP